MQLVKTTLYGAGRKWRWILKIFLIHISNCMYWQLSSHERDINHQPGGSTPFLSFSLLQQRQVITNFPHQWNPSSTLLSETSDSSSIKVKFSSEISAALTISAKAMDLQSLQTIYLDGCRWRSAALSNWVYRALILGNDEMSFLCWFKWLIANIKVKVSMIFEEEADADGIW